MYQRYRPLIPVLMLTACCISTIIFTIHGIVTIDGEPSNFELTIKHYGAFLATSATLASFFLLRQHFKHFFILTFLLGVFGLINFTVAELSIGLSFGEAHIGLSPLLILIGLVTFLLNYAKVNLSLSALINPSDEKIARIQQEEIAEFKSKFSRKSTEELAQIVAAKTLIPSALAAARQLLQERQ